jgi:hypothetical protein
MPEEVCVKSKGRTPVGILRMAGHQVILPTKSGSFSRAFGTVYSERRTSLAARCENTGAIVRIPLRFDGQSTRGARPQINWIMPIIICKLSMPREEIRSRARVCLDRTGGDFS